MHPILKIFLISTHYEDFIYRFKLAEKQTYWPFNKREKPILVILKKLIKCTLIGKSYIENIFWNPGILSLVYMSLKKNVIVIVLKKKLNRPFLSIAILMQKTRDIFLHQCSAKNIVLVRF